MPRALAALPRIAFCVLGMLLLAAPARAEEPTVRIVAARVGIPPGGPTVRQDERGQTLHVSKFGTWAPVYVELQVLAATDEPVELAIETPDADETLTTLAVPLSLVGVQPNTTVAAWTLGRMPYLKSAGGTGETTFTVRSANGVALSEPLRVRNVARDPLTYVVLTLGGKQPGFELPKPTGSQATTPAEGGTIRNGRVEVAALTSVDDLPDEWFGYDAADLVVLTTSNLEFVERLFSPNSSAADARKREALVEWVRRGGRIAISVGSHAAAVKRLPSLEAMLPSPIDSMMPLRSVPELALSWSARETASTTTIDRLLSVKGGTVPVANLVPKAGRGRVVIPPPGRSADNPEPLAVQSSFGVGRITLIAFDLDRPPFSDFADRSEFWDWVLRECGANRASIGQESKPRMAGTGPSDEEDEVAAAIRTHMDTFTGVPVISFGWVAVLIACYILLIGPIEYYFLKRVFGRLELTWLTFPIIVATVCVVAYLSASALKGHHLRVNKLDIVEVVAEFDPQTGKPVGHIYGTTWFTLFSPKIDRYTLGVTPAEGWHGTSDPTLIAWSGGPRGVRASLSRRRYAYHVDPRATADALENVHIQVWSTKSFTAHYAAGMDPASPIVESRLYHPIGGPELVFGTFVNRMPFPELRECVAFYAGKAYPLGTILADSEVRLVLDKSREVPAIDWLQREGQLSSLLSLGPIGSATPTAQLETVPLWGVLFHEASLRNEEGVYPRNASLRKLDQSWRLSTENRSEVIIVGRMATTTRGMNVASGGPNSPSNLWLQGVPQPGESAPDVQGIGRQETFVRIYLPVKPGDSP